MEQFLFWTICIVLGLTVGNLKKIRLNFGFRSNLRNFFQVTASVQANCGPNYMLSHSHKMILFILQFHDFVNYL